MGRKGPTIQRRAVTFSFALLSVGIFPSRSSAQGLPPAARPPIPISVYELNFVKKYVVWPIFGRVTSFQGEPVGGAKVRLDVGIKAIPAQVVETNLQGDFGAEFKIDAEVKRIDLEVTASRDGFLEAREAAAFTVEHGVTSVDVLMKEDSVEPDVLSPAQLLEIMRPRLSLPSSGRADDAAALNYRRALGLLYEQRLAADAVREFSRTVEAEPTCIRCRTGLGLARIVAGSYMSARRDLEEAAAAAGPAASAPCPEPWIALGVLATWRHDTKQALGYFLKALEMMPGDALALQEAGRALILQQEWEAADQYLEKALAAGASPDARLLRVRVLLELGDTPEAESEMQTFLAGRPAKEMPAPVRLLYARLQDRLQLQAYGAVRSFVDQPLTELVRIIPELAGVEPGAREDELAPLLDRAGQTVEGFFRHLPNTISREDIRQEILRRDGKVLNTLEEQFLYLLVLRPQELPANLRELRTTDIETGTPAVLKKGFMRTSGFAITSLHFHPLYRSCARFRLLGRQRLDGRPTAVIAFAQRPETSKIFGRFDVDGKSVPVLIQGLAWVDTSNYQILRMRTDLLRSPPRSRLKRETTEIQFGEVRFKDFPTAMWLPREVTVTVEWKGKVFRNWHRYSDFKVFKVDTLDKRKEAARPAPGPKNPV